MDRSKRKTSPKKEGERGRTLGDIRGVKRRDRNENVFARPNGLRESAETGFSCRRPGPARKKKRGIPVVGWRRKKVNRAARAATQTRVEPTYHSGRKCVDTTVRAPPPQPPEEAPSTPPCCSPPVLSRFEGELKLLRLSGIAGTSRPCSCVKCEESRERRPHEGKLQPAKATVSSAGFCFHKRSIFFHNRQKRCCCRFSTRVFVFFDYLADF